MFDPKHFRLDDQVAIVTGAGAGIGKAIALTFAAAGAAVVASDLHAETAEAVAEEIRAAGGRAAGLACNVTDEVHLEAVVKAAVNHLTRNIAFDLGPRGIRVNAIAPGAIRTAALMSVLTPDIEKTMLKHTPIARLGEPSDIANAALFLCAPPPAGSAARS